MYFAAYKVYEIGQSKRKRKRQLVKLYKNWHNTATQVEKNSYSQYTDKELKVTVVVNEINELTFKFYTGARFDERKCPQNKHKLKIKNLCLILPFDFEVNLEHLTEACNSELIF